MPEGSTLNSRLRVLVAKTFRAEKLYSSLRSNSPLQTSLTAGPLATSELANDLRAKEWQKTHTQLRTALNEILALGATSATLAQLSVLGDRFSRLAAESAADVDKGAQALADTARRHEFGHALKLSLDLVQLKARAQATKAVAEELTALLESCGRSVSTALQQDLLDRSEAPVAPREPEVEAAPSGRSNVIPLRRTGSRHHRF